MHLARSASTLSCLLLISIAQVLCEPFAANQEFKPANASTPCPDVLFVLEYDGKFDWELVQINDPWFSSFVTWLLGLSDRLTQSASDPVGADMMVFILTGPPLPETVCALLKSFQDKGPYC